MTNKVARKMALIEEKCNLLTCIIEWMMMESKCKVKPYRENNMLFLFELHERVNSAVKMVELTAIGEELTKFKHEHPELEN
ncbi:MAG: hypothetical protein AAB358_00445 [Patescibacteria group bacterium]